MIDIAKNRNRDIYFNFLTLKLFKRNRNTDIKVAKTRNTIISYFKFKKGKSCLIN